MPPNITGCLVKGHDGLPPVLATDLCIYDEGGICSAGRISLLRAAVEAGVLDSTEKIPDGTQYFPATTTVAGLIDTLTSLTQGWETMPKRHGPSRMNCCSLSLNDEQARNMVAETQSYSTYPSPRTV